MLHRLHPLILSDNPFVALSLYCSAPIQEFSFKKKFFISFCSYEKFLKLLKLENIKKKATREGAVENA